MTDKETPFQHTVPILNKANLDFDKMLVYGAPPLEIIYELKIRLKRIHLMLAYEKLRYGFNEDLFNLAFDKLENGLNNLEQAFKENI